MASSPNALEARAGATRPAREGAGMPRGRILQQRADVPVLVTRVEPGGVLTLAAAADVRIGAEERIAFEHRGQHSGPVRALVDVTAFQRQGSAARITVRCRVLHSTAGIATLRSFVQETLRLRPVDDLSAYPAGAGGHYYRVAEHHAAEVVAPAERAAPAGVTVDPYVERRRAPRLPVRVNISYRHDGSAGARPRRAIAYNVSINGLFALTPVAPPPRGVKIFVSFPVSTYARPVSVDLIGEVVWSMEPGSGPQGQGGFGVDISGFGERADEKLWARYIAQETEFKTDRVEVRSTGMPRTRGPRRDLS